jgi:hypothetical protein
MRNDLWMGATFLVRLPGFLRRSISLDQAQRILQQRIRDREAAFLTLIRRAIYDHRASVYRRLLKLAGCEYGDLEQIVHRDGVEAALRLLCRRGVYLTVDEFKGRTPIVRGGTVVPVAPDAFWNPLSSVHAFLHTGGSRGATAPVPLDLQFVRDEAVNFRLALHARGGSDWRHALWWAPGGSALHRVLSLWAVGLSPDRWFSPVDVASAELHRRYRWSIRAVRWGSRAWGRSVPRCEHVPLSDPLPIARWMADTLRLGAVPGLSAATSAAVSLAVAARQAGIDLRGAKITTAGEPVTAARLEAIRAAGIEAFPGYGAMETGPIAWGCLRPEAPDDSHVHHDLHALIQTGSDEAGPRLPSRTLLLSSLRPSAPILLLNVSLGDEAVVVQRRCGCPMERLGWMTHVHSIRSFEKLTAASVNLLDADVIRVLEDVLPARFGGGPTHYQLVEDEGQVGDPRIRLLVHPDVGPVDCSAVAQAFLAAIGPGSGPDRIAALLWRDGRLLEVERQPPVTTQSGKILHVLSRGDLGARRESIASRSLQVGAEQ